MKPYYQRGDVTIWHTDSRRVLPRIADGSIDLIVTDPPYSEKTHVGAETTTPGKRLVDFASIDADDLRQRISEFARVACRWFVATMDWRHVDPLSTEPPRGWGFVRHGAWTKPDPAPQFSGDRPGQGWESIAFMHRKANGRMRWNGGGRSSVFHHSVKQPDFGSYPTAKPLPLIREFVSLFADEGGTVFDPFMGSGTTLVAAIERGHPAIGCDISERACEIAARRVDRALSQGVLFR